MSNLATRTFVLAPTSDRYLTLAKEEYARTLSPMSNLWNQIRLGVMFAFSPNGTSNITSARLMMGMCSGNTHPFADPSTTTNFFGVDFCTRSNPALGTLTYDANSGNPVFTTSTDRSGVGIKRVATTNTYGSLSSIPTGYFPINTGSVQRRGLYFLDITKGSPNYTYKSHFLGSLADAGADYSYQQFKDTLETLTSGSLTCGSASLSNTGNSTLAMDESAGILDTVNIYWNNASYPIEIYTLGAFRVN